MVTVATLVNSLANRLASAYTHRESIGVEPCSLSEIGDVVRARIEIDPSENDLAPNCSDTPCVPKSLIKPITWRINEKSGYRAVLITSFAYKECLSGYRLFGT